MRTVWQRLNKRYVGLASVGPVILVLIQLFQGLHGYGGKEDPFFSSPFTLWLGIDPFGEVSQGYFFILPLVAALPAATLLQRDRQTGFLMQLRIRLPQRQILTGYMGWSAVLGGLAVAGPLLLNLVGYLLMVLSLWPDNLLHSNLGLFSFNTIAIGFYYAHPLIHALIAILVAGVWGSLFALLVTTIGFFTDYRFVAVSVGMVLQIGLLVVQPLTGLDSSLSPAQFLKEASNADVTWQVVLMVTIAMLALIGILGIVGWHRRVDG
ncbi:hypothetical protein FD13_GL001200 [Levilactobacillus senmaizukei DSM 21775 = NBRC 103853]|uniref:Uncharacterized protein n=1 Tax=Levilactobacillus senmaizukei DSM 21775 = NBRC 103853 TaxID=1423803 RepID=A0A0R2DI13_9LACO|nr:hypothetical protein [Levilactobacillus senmaizukei]KRN01237.1 hypothetical protein FD13_GL001200 [Levilactobacillus senmaizukei DSM 21775 = NBRC 103853]